MSVYNTIVLMLVSRAVEVEEIVQHLLTLCPLIALVDANLLKCLWCNSLVSVSYCFYWINVWSLRQ